MKATRRTPHSCSPCCIWSLKDDPSLRPLARLDNGRETLIVGGVAKNVCWMPEHLFLPFLFSPDRTVDWADMRLDAFGTNVLLDAMDAMQARQPRLKTDRAARE